MSGVGGQGAAVEPSGPGTRWLFVVTGPLPSSAKCHMCSWAGGCGSRRAVRPEPHREAGARPVRAAVGLGVSRPDLTFSPGRGTVEVLELGSAFRNGLSLRSSARTLPGVGQRAAPHSQPACALGGGPCLTLTPLLGAPAPCSPASTAAEESVSERCSGPARPPWSPPRRSAALQINSRALDLLLEAPDGLQISCPELPAHPAQRVSATLLPLRGLCHPVRRNGRCWQHLSSCGP